MKFPQKLWTLVSNDRTSALGWNPAGDGILINHNRFVECYLNTGVFKTSRMASFVRQLNLYGFRKTNGTGHSLCTSATDSSPVVGLPEEDLNVSKENPYPPGIREYKHPYFNRQHPETLCMVCRVTFSKTGRTRPPVYRKRAANSGDGRGRPPPSQRPRFQEGPLLDLNRLFPGNQGGNNATLPQQYSAHYYSHGPPPPYAPLNSYATGCGWPPTLHWNERLPYQDSHMPQRPMDPYMPSYFGDVSGLPYHDVDVSQPTMCYYPTHVAGSGHVSNANGPLLNQYTMGPQYQFTMPWACSTANVQQTPSVSSVLPATNRGNVEEDDDDYDNDDDFDDDDCFDDEDAMVEHASSTTSGVHHVDANQAYESSTRPTTLSLPDRSLIMVDSDDLQRHRNTSLANAVPSAQPVYMSPLEFPPAGHPGSQHECINPANFPCPTSHTAYSTDMFVGMQQCYYVPAQYHEPVYSNDNQAPCYPAPLTQMGVTQQQQPYAQQAAAPPFIPNGTNTSEQCAHVPLETSVGTTNDSGNDVTNSDAPPASGRAFVQLKVADLDAASE